MRTGLEKQDFKLMRLNGGGKMDLGLTITNTVCSRTKKFSLFASNSGYAFCPANPCQGLDAVYHFIFEALDFIARPDTQIRQAGMIT